MKRSCLILLFGFATWANAQTGSLNLGSETKMTIADGKVYCTNLKMESGASLMENGNLVFAPGTATQIKRNITGSGIDPLTATWHYVASPVTLGTANTFFGGLVNEYDEPNQNWVAVTNSSTALVVAQGYSVAIPATGDVVFTGGVPNYGDKVMDGLTYTGAVSNYSGWHLLGNPFPCAVDWTLPGWDRVNVDATVYTYDGTQYKYYTYPNSGPPYGNMTDGTIPAEQGFMVKVSAPGTGSITIPQGARVHSSQGFYKSSLPDLLTLEVTGNGYSDQMLVHFDKNATEGFDPEYDAYKLMGTEAAPQFYSMMSDTKLAGNVLSAIDKNPVIPLGLKVGVVKTYTVTANDLGSFASGTAIFLEDLKEDRTMKLNDAPVYTFNAAPGDAEHRFNLHFNLMGINDPLPLENVVQIYASNKDIYVNIPFEMNGDILVYNMLGSLIKTTPAASNTLNRIPVVVTTGYYIVKVIGDNGTATCKVFIN